MNKTYRHELKYYISHTDLTLLSEILRNTLQLDPNSGENRDYWIRSLYFDTIDNLDFYDKMSGTLTRKKIRLRIYDVKQQKVKLEIKNKVSDYIHKDIVLISRDDALELIKGNQEVLLKDRHPVLQRVYYFMHRHFYRPCTMVEYDREAYISPLQDIRLTFDKNIRSEGTHFDLFGTNVPVTPVFDENTVVLEVKFNHFLPDWVKGILNTFKSERDAISKYCMGRNLFY